MAIGLLTFVLSGCSAFLGNTEESLESVITGTTAQLRTDIRPTMANAVMGVEDALGAELETFVADLSYEVTANVLLALTESNLQGFVDGTVEGVIEDVDAFVSDDALGAAMASHTRRVVRAALDEMLSAETEVRMRQIVETIVSEVVVSALSELGPSLGESITLAVADPRLRETLTALASDVTGEAARVAAVSIRRELLDPGVESLGGSVDHVADAMDSVISRAQGRLETAIWVLGGVVVVLVLVILVGLRDVRTANQRSDTERSERLEELEMLGSLRSAMKSVQQRHPDAINELVKEAERETTAAPTANQRRDDKFSRMFKLMSDMTDSK